MCGTTFFMGMWSIFINEMALNWRVEINRLKKILLCRFPMIKWDFKSLRIFLIALKFIVINSRFSLCILKRKDKHKMLENLKMRWWVCKLRNNTKEVQASLFARL